MKFQLLKSVALSAFAVSLFASSAHSTATTPIFVRPSIFSTSTDWEAVTGLRLSEYIVRFGRNRTIGNIGLELYFLDGFPCYAQSESARSWVSPTTAYAIDQNTFMRIVCLAQPLTVQLAFREATSGASQGRTTGMLTCPAEKSGRDVVVDLTTCERLDSWNDFK